MASVSSLVTALSLINYSQAITFQSSDQEIVQAKLKQFWKYRHLETNYLCFLIAESFIGTPYQENTLETNQNEELVINLRAFDCVTFLDNVIALCLCLKSNHQEIGSFEFFCRNIQLIRYRKGLLSGYESRLHYFSDWLRDGQRKGLLQLLPANHKQLAEVNLLSNSLTDCEKKESIQIVESKLNLENTKWPISYFDCQDLNQVLNSRINARANPQINTQNPEKFLLRSGNIIGFVSNKVGLDFNHVAFVKQISSSQGENLTFIHASSINRQVEIYDGSLLEYCQSKKSNKGITAAKLSF
jgi:hypothetical protein